MYCKRCGTKQVSGHMFCPKCGEPFLEEKPHPQLNDDKKDSPNDDLNDTNEKVSSYFNDRNISLATKILTGLFVLWFFVKNGLSASPIWYVAIVAILIVAFKKLYWKNIAPTHVQYLSSILCLVLMLIVAWGGAKSSSDNVSNLFGGTSDNSGPREICITLRAETDRATGPDERMRNVLSSSGNYGFRYDEGHFYSDEIIVPSGKSWTYKDYEVHFNGGDGCVPDILHYFMGYKNERYKAYNCRNDSRNIPIFRGNDKLKIMIYRYDEDNRKSMEVKVYFVEKDDDLNI